MATWMLSAALSLGCSWASHPPASSLGHTHLLPASPPQTCHSSSELWDYNNNSYQLTVGGTVAYIHIFIYPL